MGTYVVIVYGEATVARFSKTHPQSRKQLNRFVSVVVAAEWRNFDELKRSFPSADYTPETGSIIFNIGGNKYRLAAKVDFATQLFVIDSVMTHAEYDKRVF